MGSEVYHHLKNVIKAKYGQDACNVGDEGGFAPNIQSNNEGKQQNARKLHLYKHFVGAVVVISLANLGGWKKANFVLSEAPVTVATLAAHRYITFELGGNNFVIKFYSDMIPPCVVQVWSY